MNDLVAYIERNAASGKNSVLVVVEGVLNICCKQGRCISEDVKTVEKLAVFIKESSVANFLLVVQDMEQLRIPKEHYLCIMELICIVMLVKKEELKNLDDIEFKNLQNTAMICLTVSDKMYPLYSELEFSTRQDFENNVRMNANLTRVCLKVYCILITLWEEHCKESSKVDVMSKRLIQRTCVQAIICISCRRGKFSWTNEEINALCNKLVNKICFYNEVNTVSELLCGIDEKGKYVGGYFWEVLDRISVYFTKDAWRKSLTVRHAFLWCITNVKYPHLDDHISKIVPPLLLMMESLDNDEKVVGVTTLMFVLNNVNSSSLLTFNHADVLYESLFKFLYSNNDTLYEICLPSLEKILLVIDRKPSLIRGVEYTRWDQCFIKILENLQFTNKLTTRRIFIKGVLSFVKRLEGNTIKHFQRIISNISVCLEYSDGILEKSRFCALEVLSESIKSCWPIIPKHLDVLYKMLLKFLVNLNFPGLSCSIETKNELTLNVIDIFKLLRSCSRDRFDEVSREILSGELDSEFQVIKTCFSKAMSAEDE